MISTHIYDYSTMMAICSTEHVCGKNVSQIAVALPLHVIRHATISCWFWSLARGVAFDI